MPQPGTARTFRTLVFLCSYQLSSIAALLSKRLRAPGAMFLWSTLHVFGLQYTLTNQFLCFKWMLAKRAG